VAVIDTQGRIVGRNGTNMSRGDSIGTYAGLKATLTSGQSGSDIWYEGKDRVLASYVVVRESGGGAIMGALVASRPLNDTLARVSEATTGRALDVVVPTADSFDVVGNSATRLAQLDEAVGKSAKDMLRSALTQQQTGNVRDGDYLFAASPLPAFADGKRALL